MLLPHPAAFAHGMLPEMLDVFSPCVVIELSVAPTNSSPAVLRTAPDTPIPRGDHLMICGLYLPSILLHSFQSRKQSTYSFPNSLIASRKNGPKCDVQA
jgi:hypothetical protein